MKKNLSQLLKSEAELPKEELDAVESFDNALDELSKSAADEGKPEDKKEPELKKGEQPKAADNDELKKAKKADEDDEEEDEESEEDENIEEEGDEEEEEDEESAPPPPPKRKGKMKKSSAQSSVSIEEIVREDKEAAAAMDVEPFLKSLVRGIDTKISALQAEVEGHVSALSATVEKMVTLQKAQSNAIVAEGALIKSALGVDEKTLQQPTERRSTLVVERFAKSQAGEEPITIGEAKTKLIEFAKSGALNPVQVSIVEGRLNKGQDLPSYFTQLLRKA